MGQVTPNGIYESKTGEVRLTIERSNSDNGEHFGNLEQNGRKYDVRGNYFYMKTPEDKSSVTFEVRATSDIDDKRPDYIKFDLFSTSREYNVLKGEYRMIGGDRTPIKIELYKKK
ncbi:hypothetical protein [Pseudomonas sp. RT6P73]